MGRSPVDGPSGQTAGDLLDHEEESSGQGVPAAVRKEEPWLHRQRSGRRSLGSIGSGQEGEALAPSAVGREREPQPVRGKRALAKTSGCPGQPGGHE
ncbi:MAG: hypothetical protein HFG22_17870 [Lachnospiraceae bacterium]|nr:hypothetical protein [Lachnospiraceae bacterium]